MEQQCLNQQVENTALQYRKNDYWLPLNLGQRLGGWAECFGERTALICGTDRLSYRELNQRVDAMAVALYKLGLRRSDRVLVQLPNSTGFVVTIFALFRLGVIPVMMLMANRDHDIDAFCSLAEPKAFFTTETFLGFSYRKQAEQAQIRHACLKHVVVDGTVADAQGNFVAVADNTLSLLELKHEEPEPKDTAVLLLSGGTTGTSKLIPRTHADYAYNAIASADLCGFSQETVYLVALAAAHNFPLACPGIIGTLSTGGQIVLAHSPAPEECLPLIEKERVTHTALVPPMVNLWLSACTWEKHDLSSLRLLQVGGSALDAELAARIRPILGCQLQQVFGTAEGLLCYTRLDDPEEVILHTQGRPLSPDDDVRLVDEEGRDVPTGAIGELWVRGPYTIHGYYRAEEQNKRAFTADGYYRSGDLVRRRADGNFVVAGRMKDVINRAGEKIAAPEIEAVLKTHANIEDAVLVPVPDEYLGERSCAFVIKGAAPLDLPMLRVFLAEKGLARHKMPDQLELVEAWPLTGAGKINKRLLSALAAQSETAMERVP